MRSEWRLDPEDGCSYTHPQIMLRYKSEFSDDQIDAYWETLTVVPGARGPPEELKLPPMLSEAQLHDLGKDIESFNGKFAQALRLSNGGHLCGLPPYASEAYEELCELVSYHVAKVGCGTDLVTSAQHDESLGLRFQKSDRVLCNIGLYWAAGTVLEVNVMDVEDPQGPTIPYLVRLDAQAGFREPIQVQFDDATTILREVCFDAQDELMLTKVAAPLLQGNPPSLRMGTGSHVCCRVQDQADLRACWETGLVEEIWPTLPPPYVLPHGRRTAQSVSYLVRLDSGRLVYAHRDDHTLVRPSAYIPQQRERGIAYRFEVLKLSDGTCAKFDHQTLQHRAMSDLSSDSEDG